MAEAADNDNISICTKLDDLAICILKVMRNIMLERQYLDGNLKDGFINMAKSRYLMRGQKISRHQINTSNLLASKKVISNDNSVNEVKFNSFHILKKESPGASGEVTTKMDSFNDSGDSDSENPYRNEISSSVENPLYWFGLLVPDALKSCQSRFEQALETSVKIATLQNELKALCESYRNLRQEKYATSA